MKEKEEGLKQILKKIYNLLENKQKLAFLLILVIMVISAGLTQVTPKAIGWLTDDILVQTEVAFAKIIPFFILILILDEATSALDNTSEKYIQTEIEKLQKENHTTIISIAHRLTTLKNCNRIIVLNKGKIEEDGTYDELIQKEGIFKDMYEGKLK